MHEVRFHLISCDASDIDSGLAAAILADSLRRQECRARLEGTMVTVPAGQSRPQDPFDVFILLDEVLLSDPQVLSRLHARSALVVCSARPARMLRQRLGRDTAGVATVDASGIATDEGTDPVAAVLGAAARLVSFIDPEALSAAVWTSFDHGFPYAAKAATRAFDLGYMQTQQALG